jgi:uncharacterized membrane protein YuzA (DUF378 family)
MVEVFMGYWTDLISNTKGTGPSVTKWAYRLVAIAGVVSFLLGSYAISHVYIKWHKCDIVMVGFVSGIFTVLTSWAAHNQNKKSLATIAQTGVDDGAASSNPKPTS